MQFASELKRLDLVEINSRIEKLYISCYLDGEGQPIPDRQYISGSLDLVYKVLNDYILVYRSRSQNKGNDFVVNVGQTSPELITKNLDGLKFLFGDLSFKISRNEAKDILNVELKAKRSKKDKTKTKKEFAWIKIYELFKGGAYENFVTVHYGKTYIPIGVGESEKIKKLQYINVWCPGQYIMYDPKSSEGHPEIYCNNYRVISGYYNFIMELAANPFVDVEDNNFKADYFDELHDIKVLMEMIYQLCNCNQKLARYFMSWMAYVIYSGKKSEVCPVLYSNLRGVGKSTLVKFLKRILGKNSISITNSVFKSNFTPPQEMESQLVNYEELSMHKLSACDLGTFKNKITCSEYHVQYKYTDAVEATNHSNFLCTVNNEPTSLSMEPGDRRFVICAFKYLKRYEDGDKRRYLEHLADFNRILDGSSPSSIPLPTPNPYHFSRTHPNPDDEKKIRCENCSTNGGYYKDLIVLFSFLLHQIYLRDQERTNGQFKPSLDPPITDLHVAIQLSSKEAKFLHSLVKSGSNCNRENFKCLYPRCDLELEEHFDELNPNWQIKHVRLENLLASHSTNLSTQDIIAECPKYGINVEFKASALNYFYEFPAMMAFEKKLYAPLNMSIRSKV
jgi:hypothetical protein